MKKYGYFTLFTFLVFFILSFFTSYYYFSHKYSLIAMAKVEVKSINALATENKSEKLDKASEVVKTDKPLYAKEVFLTIDDGPSTYNTLRNLKTLKDNGVKATFFVVGKQAEELPQVIKEIYNSGMSIENHSYSHNYNSYKSEEACFNDFDRCDNVLLKLLNKKKSKFVRFPGGSDNQVSNKEVMSKIRKNIIGKGLNYVDWNVSAGDAQPIKLGPKELFKNIVDQCENKNFAVVLIHDAQDKKNTADALDKIIKYLKSKGFIFRTFDDITPTEIKEMIKLKILNRGA